MKTCCCPVCGTGLSGCLAPPPPFPGKQSNNQANSEFAGNSLISQQFSLFRLFSFFLMVFLGGERKYWNADVDHIAILFLPKPQHCNSVK